MTTDRKEAAEKEYQRQVSKDGASAISMYIAGAEHGYAEGIEEKNDMLEKLIDSANQLKQQVEAYRDAIKDKDLAYSLMKEACEDFKQQLADMKWEYENACKFETDFEQQRDRLKAEVESYKRAKAENDERFQLEAGALRLDLEREREANAKLREALEAIASDRWIVGECLIDHFKGLDEKSIAKQALLNMSPESQNIDISKERVADAAKQDGVTK